MPLNSVTIIGNVGREPEIKYTADKKAIAKFSVAVNEKFKKNGELVDHTEWFNVVAFDRTAEIVGEYVAKGREVCVQGKLRTDEYEKNGEKKRWTELVASNVVLLSNGGRDRAEGAPPQGIGGVPREQSQTDFP